MRVAKKKQPFVVVVVTSWNGLAITYKGKPITKLCIDSLKKTKYQNMAIVIADEGSMDGSVKYFSNQYKEIGISRAEDRGWCYGANKGMEYAFKQYPNLDYIALLNNDMIFRDRDWLAKLVGAAQKEESIGAVGCKLTYPDGRIQHGGAKATFFGIKFETDRQKSQVSRRISLVTGAVLLLKRAALLKTGLVDEIFLPFNWEDADFEARIVKEGFSIYYVGNTEITHLESYSFGPGIKKNWTREQIARFSRRNGYIYYLRYKRWLVPLYFLSDFMSNFIAFAPSLHMRDGKTMASRLGMQIPAFSEALRTYKTHKVNKRLLK